MSWQTVLIVRWHIGLSMLPSHRIMRQGKQVYDDDDKYNKYDKPWTSHHTWRQVRSILHLQGNSIQKPSANAICKPDFPLISQKTLTLKLQKPLIRYTLFAFIFVTIILLYAFESNHTEMIERWKQNGGVYNAGDDPGVVRDDKNNEVISNIPNKNSKGKDGQKVGEIPANDKNTAYASDEERDYEKVKEMMDKSEQKPVSGHGVANTLLFTQSPPPAALFNADPKWAERQEKVRLAFKHAWKGYATDAFGMDEYQPLSHRGHDWSPGGIGLMIIDSLDTIMLMNLEEEYTQARDWIENRLSFDKNQDVNLFETTIRILGGLLSAYHLSDNDQLYLDKAIDLGDRLLGAFDSDSGIPHAGVVLSTGMAHKVHYIQSSTAEVTTIQMEMKYLSHLTGNKKYWDKAEQVMERIRQLIDENQTLDGLVPILIEYVTLYASCFLENLMKLNDDMLHVSSAQTLEALQEPKYGWDPEVTVIMVRF